MLLLSCSKEKLPFEGTYMCDCDRYIFLTNDEDTFSTELNLKALLRVEHLKRMQYDIYSRSRDVELSGNYIYFLEYPLAIELRKNLSFSNKDNDSIYTISGNFVDDEKLEGVLKTRRNSFKADYYFNCIKE